MARCPMTLADVTLSPSVLDGPAWWIFRGLVVRTIPTAGTNCLESEKGKGRVKCGSLGILKIGFATHLFLKTWL